MAWDNQGNSVGGHAVPHGSGGAFDTRLGCKLPIGLGFTIENLPTMLKNLATKSGHRTWVADNIAEVVNLALRIGLKPPN